MFAFLWASVCQMIRIIANVTFASRVGSDLYGCWWFYITLGLVVLVFAWGFAQVRMLVMRRRRITILEMTFVMCVIFVCSSLFTRGSLAMFAKRNFSFTCFIAGFFARFRFEIGSVCSLSFLSEWSVLYFFRSEEDDFCFSTLFKLCCFLSDLRKKVRQDLVVLCAG